LVCFQHVNRSVYRKESLFPVNKQLTARCPATLSHEAGRPLRYHQAPVRRAVDLPTRRRTRHPAPGTLTGRAGCRSLVCSPADLSELGTSGRRGPALHRRPCLTPERRLVVPRANPPARPSAARAPDSIGRRFGPYGPTTPAQQSLRAAPADCDTDRNSIGQQM
jgi:hypothetical protein